MATTKKLGQVLIEKGLATEDQINEALRIQVGGNRRLGYILILMGVLTNDQLLNVLSAHINIPIIDIDHEFRPEAKSIMPRYLCFRYSAIPFAIESDNIVELAMLDPSDDEAIREIEQYTGKAVKPFLAHETKIKTSIPKHIPYGIKDLFHSPLPPALIRSVAILLIAGTCFTGYYAYNVYKLEKYGTITVSANITTYKNQDLMIELDDHSISLMGHGAYAQGFYKVSFNNSTDLKTFLEKKKTSFSSKQYEWLTWVVDNKINPSHHKKY